MQVSNKTGVKKHLIIKKSKATDFLRHGILKRELIFSALISPNKKHMRSQQLIESTRKIGMGGILNTIAGA
jgi:hypothetical protein